MTRLHDLRWGLVEAAEAPAGGRQPLLVSLARESRSELRRALAYPALTGAVRAGDRVLLNTTAADLGLGSGGVDFVALVARRPRGETGDSASSCGEQQAGRQMKLRYTPWQIRVSALEEGPRRSDYLAQERRGLGGLPVVLCELHSQLWPVLFAARCSGYSGPAAYVMTDGGALPAAWSRTLPLLRGRGLLQYVVTAGHAFGGDAEAVDVASGLLAARALAGAGLCLVGIGPGIAGTASRFGNTALGMADALHRVVALAGRPVAVLRLAGGDRRRRHRGLSHHTATVLGQLSFAPALLALPRRLGALPPAELRRRLSACGALRLHTPVDVEVEDLLAAWRAGEAAGEAGAAELAQTMGRGAAGDPDFFRACLAAGRLAGMLAARSA